MIPNRLFRVTIEGEAQPHLWDLGDADVVLHLRSDYDFLKMLSVGEFMTDVNGDMWERVQ